MGKVKFKRNTQSSRELRRMAQREQTREQRQKAKTQQEQATMEARQEAERKKIEAEASAEVVKQQADAEAYETRVKAEAQAEANKKVAETITKELIDYVQAQNWNGQLPTIYAGDGNVPIIANVPEQTKEPVSVG